MAIRLSLGFGGGPESWLHNGCKLAFGSRRRTGSRLRCGNSANVDVVFARAISEGRAEIRPLQNQFYGDRSEMVRDPFGHRWPLTTNVEDFCPEELEKRTQAMFSNLGSPDG